MTEVPEGGHELLREILTGDRGRDDPVVLQLASKNPVFAKRLLEFEEMEALMAGASREAEELLEQATKPASDEEMERLERWVTGGGRLDERSVGGTGTRGYPRWLAAAAVLLLGLGIWIGQGANKDPIWMGSEGLRILQPSGDVEAFFPVRWEGELGTGSTYTVRIWNADRAGPMDMPVLQKEELRDNEWNPNPAEQERLKDAIVIEVSIRSSTGGDQASTRHSAQLAGS